MISSTRIRGRTTRSRSAGLALLVSLAVAGLAACSSTGAGASAAPSAADAAGAGGTVDVILQEFAILPSVPSIGQGSVTFNATNKGPDDAHELVVFKTDLGLRDLPASAEGKVDEEGAGLTFIGEIEEFDPGKTASGTYDLAPGRYVLVCNIVQDEPDGSKESHYIQGMEVEFIVN